MDLRLGSCEEILAGLEADSIDSIVTDPPYGWRFMGKAWDSEDIERDALSSMGKDKDILKMFSDGKMRRRRIRKANAAGSYDLSPTGNECFQVWTETWAKEAYRVLKPGGHIIVFCGPRTYHRMASGVEDAGFEIRDQLQWLFGQGFPKSMDIGKAIDKAAGAERELVPRRKLGQISDATDVVKGWKNTSDNSKTLDPNPITDLAKHWDGWGTALKPANEPILLARKPLSEKTVAANVLRWGTGGINVDGSRIGTGEDRASGGIRRIEHEKNPGTFQTGMNQSERPIGGRFPSNLLLDEEAARMLDEQSGRLKSGDIKPYNRKNRGGYSGPTQETNEFQKNGDSGGASRFFYVAKASTRERGEGNVHPTVKPIKLMEYLVRLVTPPNGIVLDPFMGSGTTGIAAKNLGFHFLGIEKNPSYMEIARKRIG